MVITKITMTAAIANETRTAGPAAEMALAEPTKKPAPITPPIEIMVICRLFRPFESLPPTGGVSCVL
jgi:hypothetical protein